MLLKHCTQYTSKFGKLNSGHRTGKGEFSFQCQRKAMPKNVQITIQFNGTPHQYSCLENLMERGASWAVVHGVTKSQTQLSVFWNSLAFSRIQWMLAIWSLVPLSFLNPAFTSGSSWFTYCWSLVWIIFSITLLACDMSATVSSLNFLWHCPSLGLEWKLTISSPVATSEFSKFAGIWSAALSQHHLLGFEIAQLEFHHLH